MQLLRRKKYWVFASLLCAAVAIFFLWPTSLVTEENCNRIEIGMTEEQVVAVLGARGERNEEAARKLRQDIGPDFGPSTDNYKLWFGPDGCLILSFDAEGKVVDKCFADDTACLETPSWAAWLRNLFRNRKRVIQGPA